MKKRLASILLSGITTTAVLLSTQGVALAAASCSSSLSGTNITATNTGDSTSNYVQIVAPTADLTDQQMSDYRPIITGWSFDGFIDTGGVRGWEIMKNSGTLSTGGTLVVPVSQMATPIHLTVKLSEYPAKGTSNCGTTNYLVVETPESTSIFPTGAATSLISSVTSTISENLLPILGIGAFVVGLAVIAGLLTRQDKWAKFAQLEKGYSAAEIKEARANTERFL